MATIAEVLQEIEDENTSLKVQLYKNFVNQPEKLCISSQNAITAQTNFNVQTNNSYYNFTINLPRPLLNVKSIQLLRASIPQCSQSLSDSSCVFYYYKLPTQLDINGDTYYTQLPSLTNLYCIRLLPSYYKQELIDTPSLYGYNQTFNNYDELLTQLNLSAKNDLAVNNGASTFPFIANDIEFTLLNNRFQMTGNNVNTTTFWVQWNVNNLYVLNDIVQYSDRLLYIAKSTVPKGIAPGNTTYWQSYTQTTNFNTYLSAGYLDPNVIALGKTINTLSEQYDFELLVDIPGQPYYQQVQNRTLNLILGFTWNGLYFNINQLITPTIYPQGSSAPNLLNRLRPIPIYALVTGLGSPYPQVSTGTYTADGFCNLVFSSICSIYTTIIGSATLDTQRNTNLLSIIPMNCPNLGVSFYNNVINNELTKVISDIYSIYIELRAEDSTPYLISNNGIITIDLKLTY